MTVQTKPSDYEVVAGLTGIIGVAPKEAEYDDEGNLFLLDLSELRLSELTSGLWQLSNTI